eukprot:6100226-Prymnesium_polylepis.1
MRRLRLLAGRGLLRLDCHCCPKRCHSESVRDGMLSLMCTHVGLDSDGIPEAGWEAGGRWSASSRRHHGQEPDIGRLAMIRDVGMKQTTLWWKDGVT